MSKPRKKPGPPTKVTEELIGVAERMLACRCHKAEVKDVLKKRGISARLCEKVITTARGRLVSASDKPVQDHRNEAYQFYDAILRDPMTSPRERIKAQERIDRLLGLESPVRLEHTGAGGGPIRVEPLKNLSTEELEELERLAAKAAGPEGDPGGAGGA